ncbi:MAG: ThiF family adenylyltransferase [Candidatus Saccharimonas sp.]
MTYTITREETADGVRLQAVHDVEVDWSDQTGWFDPQKVQSAVTLIGCGGIGSNVAFELIGMGVKRFELYDDDKVEPRNLASQKAFRHRDLYGGKPEKLAEVLFEYGAEEVVVHNRYLTEDDIIENSLVIGGVDSMKSRQIILKVVENSPNVELYLDGRLDKLVAQILAVETLDLDWYRDEWMYSDEEASTTVDCTMRAIVFPATFLAATMCRHVSNWYLGLPICRFIQVDTANMEILKIGDIEE